MKNSRLMMIIAICATMALGACAQSPDSIVPVSMGNTFETMNCRDAHTLLTTERQTLAALSAKQRDAVVGDAFGVFLLGVPMASLTGGDNEGGIATSKGKIVALENRLLRC